MFSLYSIILLQAKKVTIPLGGQLSLGQVHGEKGGGGYRHVYAPVLDVWQL